MSDLKQKVKNLLEKIGKLGEWLGNHLGTVLLVFSAFITWLFLGERKKRISAETSLQLNENDTKIEVAKKEVEHAENDAKDSLDNYLNAKREYDKGRNL